MLGHSSSGETRDVIVSNAAFCAGTVYDEDKRVLVNVNRMCVVHIRDNGVAFLRISFVVSCDCAPFYFLPMLHQIRLVQSHLTTKPTADPSSTLQIDCKYAPICLLESNVSFGFQCIVRSFRAVILAFLQKRLFTVTGLRVRTPAASDFMHIIRRKKGVLLQKQNPDLRKRDVRANGFGNFAVPGVEMSCARTYR